MPAASAFDADLAEWRPWRPEKIARLLARVDVPWYVAGGWAIDLFLGEERREHEDLEIGVPSKRSGEVAAALAGFEPFVVGPDPAAAGRDLAVPVAQAGELLERYHQTWVLEREPFVWRLDVFREPSGRDTWICRRDERIRLPYERLIERLATTSRTRAPRSSCSSRSRPRGRRTTTTSPLPCRGSSRRAGAG